MRLPAPIRRARAWTRQGQAELASFAIPPRRSPGRRSPRSRPSLARFRIARKFQPPGSRPGRRRRRQPCSTGSPRSARASETAARTLICDRETCSCDAVRPKHGQKALPVDVLPVHGHGDPARSEVERPRLAVVEGNDVPLAVDRLVEPLGQAAIGELSVGAPHEQDRQAVLTAVVLDQDALNEQFSPVPLRADCRSEARLSHTRPRQATASRQRRRQTACRRRREPV